MHVKQEYEVRLDLFQGPLDLLLYLVEKSEVNIIDIKVSQIAAQYSACLDLMLELHHELNIDVAGEYLRMAAVLMRLKSRELLPDSLPEEGLETSEGEIYNREQLIEQLLEYKKFKEAAGTLKAFELKQYGTAARGKTEEIENVSSEQNDEVVLGNISVFDLLSAFQTILKRADENIDPSHVVEVDNCRIDDRIEHILSMITDRGGEVHFEELFGTDRRRIVLVVTFMAILELVKMGQIGFRQQYAFGAIFVSKAFETKYTE